MYCKCGKEIHPKRVEILKKANQTIQCISCAEHNVERVAGFMIRDHKMNGQIQIVSQEQAQILHSLSSRAGGLQVSQGVRFHTGRK